MWLHIPSTTSRSAPAEAVSTLGLGLLASALAQCVTWRGKHSRAHTWSQRLKRVSWLTRLCGQMPEPSAADLGAAQWISSLAASRASRTAPPEESAAHATSATSGPTPDASSSSPALGACSSKTSRECSRPARIKSPAPSAYGVTYKDWVLSLRADYSARQRLARNTAGRASSSSLWPTAAARDHKGSGPTLQRSDGKMRGDCLDYAAEQLWATPISSDGEKGGPNQRFGAGTQPLTGHVNQWASPDASVANDGESPETWNARAKALKEKHGNGNGAGKPLAIQAQEMWPTPTSLSYAESRQPGNSASMNKTLELAEALWQTPAPSDVAGGRKTRSGDRASEALLNGQALACSRLAHPNGPHGEKSLNERRSLSPLFVEWLMAWPPFWTLIAWTGYGCSETAFIRYKRLMRYELLALGLPKGAPPEQTSFL